MQFTANLSWIPVSSIATIPTIRQIIVPTEDHSSQTPTNLITTSSPIVITISPTMVEQQAGHRTEVLFPTQSPITEQSSVYPTFVSHSDAIENGNDVIDIIDVSYTMISQDSTSIKGRINIDPLGISSISVFGLVVFAVCICGLSILGSQQKRTKEIQMI